MSKNASAKDIKKSYYQLAKKFHPDTNKNDPEAPKKFQAVSEAYEVKCRCLFFYLSGSRPGSTFSIINNYTISFTTAGSERWNEA